jgi:hypothetical protein
LAIGLLGEYADAGQRAQQPIECGRVRARGLGQLIYAPRAILEQVGDPEGSGHVDRLGRSEGVRQL